jgi:uroporphyrinogen-III synthase
MSLDGKVLAITRSVADSQEFSSLVRAQGGRVISLPLIKVVPRGFEAIESLLVGMEKKKYDYCAFMSPKAVDILFRLAGKESAPRIIAALASCHVIAVGPKTSTSLTSHGVQVKSMPSTYSSYGLVDLLSSMPTRGKRIVIPRSSEADEFAARSLSDLGMLVDEVFLYDIIKTAGNKIAFKDFALLLHEKRIDAIIFTSASNVKFFFEIMDSINDQPSLMQPLHTYVRAVVSIGPFTSAELKKRNIKYIEASEHTIRGTFKAAELVLSSKDSTKIQ